MTNKLRHKTMLILSSPTFLIKVNNDYKMRSPTASSLTTQTAGDRGVLFSSWSAFFATVLSNLTVPSIVSSTIVTEFSRNSSNSVAQLKMHEKLKVSPWATATTTATATALFRKIYTVQSSYDTHL